MQAVQTQSFQNRLDRIARHQNGPVKLHVGEGSDAKAAEKARQAVARGQIKPRRKAPSGAGFLICLLAFALGFAAMLGGRFLAFHYAPGLVAEDDLIGQAVAMGGDMGIALGLGITAALVFGLFSVPRAAALGAGFVLVMQGEGAVASKVPELWAEMFSPGYTRAVIENQQPIDLSVESVKARLSGLGKFLG